MRRISVVGSSGSGKTDVARRLSEALSVPHVELDALHWGANWSPATKDELAARVTAATAGKAWVVDGNYWSKLGPQVWLMADTVVWVSPPRWRDLAVRHSDSASHGDTSGVVERQPRELAWPDVLAW